MAIDPRQRERLLLITALICVGLVICDRLILRPYTAAWKARSEKIQQLKTQIQQGELLLRREAGLRRLWNQMLQSSLPTDRSEAGNQLLQAVATWARKSRIIFTSLTPQWKEGDTQDYVLLECRATAVGSLDALARFLYYLETDPLPVRIEEVQISAEDDRGQKLRMTLRFTGLQLKPPEAAKRSS